MKNCKRMLKFLFLCPTLLVSSFSNLYAQSFNYTTSSSYEIDEKEIYNKETGQLISKNEFNERIKENPYVSLEPKIDKYGNVEHYYLDLENKTGRVSIDINDRVDSGHRFPSFIMNTINGEQINSESLQGNYLLLNFQMTLDPPFFQMNSFQKEEDFVKKKKKSVPIVFIMITFDALTKAQETTDGKDLDVKVVPNGRNWAQRYFVKNYPSYILINKNGELIKYIDESSLETLARALDELK